MKKSNSDRVHFIGIGGIGVSALAKYYLKKGYKVGGSDLVSSEITQALKKEGAKIIIGKNKAKNLPKNCSLVIYSPAVQKQNPELKRAERLGIVCQSYPKALGELTRQYFTIAVSGTHGKSTTAAMIGLLLSRAGLDPTVIVGTKLKEFGNSNCRVGKSRLLVIEADEHFASFLNYRPRIIVLTTIERDHLDFYKNLKNILKTFKEYVCILPSNGWLVANKDDPTIYTTFSTIVENIVYYSLKDRKNRKLRKILKIPGEFNVLNALAALAVARILKIPDKISFKALSEYRGSWRRFEINKILYPKPCTLISDYGHHPTEIKVTLKAARQKFPKKEIWCIFQPHQHQRTFYLFKDFLKVFREAPVDKLIITDIYDVAGREQTTIKKRVNSKKLVLATRKSNVFYLPRKNILRYLRKNLKGKEVLIIMGAGDIYDLTLSLTANKIK